MKKHNLQLLLAVLTALLLSACNKDNKQTNSAFISGKLSQPLYDSLFYNIPVCFGIEFDKTAFPINSDGTFEFEIEIDKPEGAQLSSGSAYLSLFLEPGDSIYIEADVFDFAQSALFSGKGSAKHNYLVEKQKRFNNFNDTLLTRLLKSGSEQDFLNHIDSLDLLHTAFFDASLDKSFSEAFINYQRSQMIYDQSFSIFLKIHNNVLLSHGKLDTTNLSPVLYSRFEAYANKEDIYKQSLAYYNYLYTLRAYNGMKKDVKSSGYKTHQEILERDLNLILEDFTGIERDLTYGQLFYLNMVNLDTLLFDYYESQLDTIIKNPALKERLFNKRKSLGIALNRKSRASFINYALPNSGKEITIQSIFEEYQGKPLLVNIWAGWGPVSRLNLEHVERLSTRFGDNLEVIGCSLDTDSKWWKVMVAAHDQSSDQYLLNTEMINQLKSDFNLEGLPLYLLFDAEGKLVYSSSASPADPNLLQTIISLTTD